MNESLDSVARKATEKDDRKTYTKAVKKHGVKKFDSFMSQAKDDRDEYKNKMKYGKHGKMNEADMTNAPSIKDARPQKKTNVKYDPHMKLMAPFVKKA